jgi:LDH2 family malate/lactate/ureidoglycolate dehydrogenase
MQLAIDKAKRYGVGMVVIRNSTHYGHAAYYGLMADADGCIGITGTNARPSIAPTYSVEPMMGTNPLVFGIPSGDEFPFCIDCATSVQQRGKIEKWARDGKPTPAGAVIGDDGLELTDSKVTE